MRTRFSGELALGPLIACNWGRMKYLLNDNHLDLTLVSLQLATSRLMASLEHKGEAIWSASDASMRSRVTLLSQRLLGNDDLAGIELLHSYYVVFCDLLPDCAASWLPCGPTPERALSGRIRLLCKLLSPTKAKNV